MWYNLKHQLNKLNDKFFINNQIIILIMTTEEGKVKDGEKYNKKEIKDGQIIKGINKIVMDNSTDLGRTEMVITKMVTIKIMEVRKEGI